MRGAKMYTSTNMLVVYAERKYWWTIYTTSEPEKVIYEGSTSTFDEAFRNARNYIRHHQNEVFS